MAAVAAQNSSSHIHPTQYCTEEAAQPARRCHIRESAHVQESEHTRKGSVRTAHRIMRLGRQESSWVIWCRFRRPWNTRAGKTFRWGNCLRIRVEGETVGKVLALRGVMGMPRPRSRVHVLLALYRARSHIRAFYEYLHQGALIRGRNAGSVQVEDR